MGSVRNPKFDEDVFLKRFQMNNCKLITGIKLTGVMEHLKITSNLISIACAWNKLLRTYITSNVI